MSEDNGWNDLSREQKNERLNGLVHVTEMKDGYPREIPAMDVDPETRREHIHQHARRYWKRQKRQEREAERAQEEYENSKSPEYGPFRCPDCGLDAGAYNDDREQGEPRFENDQKFTVGTFSLQGHSQRKVTCPECGHEAAAKDFREAWTDAGHSLPDREPPGPYPQETAEGQHAARVRAAEAKAESRSRRGL